MPSGMDHRAAYAVVAWRSQPHLPAASATAAVVQAVHGRYDPAIHVLTGHQLALVQVVVTHIVLARRVSLTWSGSCMERFDPDVLRAV